MPDVLFQLCCGGVRIAVPSGLGPKISTRFLVKSVEWKTSFKRKCWQLDRRNTLMDFKSQCTVKPLRKVVEEWGRTFSKMKICGFNTPPLLLDSIKFWSMWKGWPFKDDWNKQMEANEFCGDEIVQPPVWERNISTRDSAGTRTKEWQRRKICFLLIWNVKQKWKDNWLEGKWNVPWLRWLNSAKWVREKEIFTWSILERTTCCVGTHWKCTPWLPWKIWEGVTFPKIMQLCVDIERTKELILFYCLISTQFSPLKFWV